MTETVFLQSSAGEKEFELLDFPCDREEFKFSSWRFDGRSEELSGKLLETQNNHFGFVQSGELLLEVGSKQFPLFPGMYFSAAGKVVLRKTAGKASLGIVMSQANYQGMFQIGGPVESTGRLHYIDGCSDTLLISPVRKGEACVNFLNLPPGTNQTFHTHPSFRFGIVFKGNGFCDANHGSTPLCPGKVFFIPTDGKHRFRTEQESLSVIAFHPDSDFGPDDDNHPMVNKTMLDGVSASKLSYQQRGITLS